MSFYFALLVSLQSLFFFIPIVALPLESLVRVLFQRGGVAFKPHECITFPFELSLEPIVALATLPTLVAPWCDQCWLLLLLSSRLVFFILWKDVFVLRENENNNVIWMLDHVLQHDANDAAFFGQQSRRLVSAIIARRDAVSILARQLDYHTS